MSRKILCLDCGETRRIKLHSDDVALGFKQRVVELIAKKPADHAITEISGGVANTTQLPTIACDNCGKPIPDGTRCTAISVWRGGEMAAWESGFGKVLL